MKYGEPFKEVEFSPQSMDIVRKAISNTDLKWNEGELQESKNQTRKSKVAWIKDNELNSMNSDFKKRLLSSVFSLS